MGLIASYKKKKGFICPLCNSTSYKNYKLRRDISISEHFYYYVNTFKSTFKGYQKSNLKICKSCEEKFSICPYCKKTNELNIESNNERIPVYIINTCNNCSGKYKINVNHN